MTARRRASLVLLVFWALAVSVPVLAADASAEAELTAAYREVARSVAMVVVRGVRPTLDPPGPMLARTEWSGSGFAIQPGLVVTNYHVIEHAMAIEVHLRNGRSARARVVGTAPGLDLALLAVGFDEEDLAPVSVQSGARLEIGQTVVAVSHPLGLQHSVSAGVVSGLRRELPGTELGANLIQFDAAINPGQSGGPLVDTDGRVVGVTTAKVLEAEGIGLAIPIDVVEAVVPDLVRMGHPLRHQVGISGVTIDPDLAVLFDIPVDWGFLVERVEEGSLAEGIGLRHEERIVHLGGHSFVLGGDIIVAIGDELIRGPGDLLRILSTLREGETLQLEVLGATGHRTVALELPPMEH